MTPKEAPRIASVDVQGDRCRVGLAFPASPEADRFAEDLAGLLEEEVDVDIEPTERARTPRVRTPPSEGEEEAHGKGRDPEELIRGIRHDLRTPLGLVTSYLDLLENEHGEDLTSEALELVRGAVEGADRLDDMIGRLGENGGASEGSEGQRPVDLDVALDDALANVRRDLEANGITVRRSPLPTVPCDAASLIRVFQNLLSNAVKYQDPGGWIRVAATAGEGTWTISVTDDGPGVPEDERDDIFAAQRRGSAADGSDGSGMGLAICRRVVEGHGGTMGVDDAPDGGARFWFRLPDSPAEGASRTGLDTP